MRRTMPPERFGFRSLDNMSAAPFQVLLQTLRLRLPLIFGCSLISRLDRLGNLWATLPSNEHT